MEVYDILIIGGGPAGLSAAIYASRAKLSCAILEKTPIHGGQMINTPDIDNYPGIQSIDGFSLSEQMKKHAEMSGTEFLTDGVSDIQKTNNVFCVKGNKSEYYARSVIIAAGARHKNLGVDGEDRLAGKGVSYCATCDGAFFRGKTVAVVGGGNTAAEEALYLSRLCEKVYLIHRRDTLRASRSIAEKVMATPNIEPLWNTTVSSIQGDMQVSGLVLGTEDFLEVDGVFVSIGMQPNSEDFSHIVKTDEYGFIISGEDGVTSVPGIFAAGDIRTKNLRQVVTAVSDGANSVASAERYLLGNN